MTNNKNTATLSEDEKHQHHIEGGYKATLSNPNSSEEARKHAQEMLDKIAKGEKVEAANPSRDANMTEEEKHQHHIEGGYKATLSNPRSSEEAKKHAQEMLDKIAKGEKVEAANPSRDANMTEEEKHQHHIEGGYKATLSNPRSSEEAKKHAQEMLDKLAKGEELSAEDKAKSSNYAAAYTEEEKHRHHVIGGLKATLKNDNVTELAKKEARDKLREMGEEVEETEDNKAYKRPAESESSKASSPKKAKKDPSEYTEEEKHNHHVAGGYKATLKNANASEEAKKNAREKLSEMGAEYQSEEESESENKGTKRSAEDSESGKGKQGFASMPKEKVQEIASKGGRTAHAGEEPAPKKSDESGSKKAKKDPSEYTEEEKHNHHVAGGYKATLKNPNSSEEAKKNAREKLDEMGAEYQDDESEGREDGKESDKEDKGKSGKGKQGFASMPKEKVQEIASKGGRTKRAGEEPTSVKQQ